MGIHAESLLFTILGLFLLYKILYGQGRRSIYAMLLGLASGFGTYFAYGVFVSVVSFILFWIYQDRLILRKKEFWLFALFFFIGFSPWMVYNSLYDFQGFGRIQVSFVYPPQRILILPLRFLKLITLKILGMLCFNYREGNRHHPQITFLNLWYYVTILFCFWVLYRFERKNPKTHFLFLYPLAFLVVATIGRFHIETYHPRYLLPLFPFFFAVIGLGLSRLGDLSRSFHKGSALILVSLLAMGVRGELNLISLKEAALSLRYRGYSYRQLAEAFVVRYPDHLKRIAVLGQRLHPRLSHSERLAFYHGLNSSRGLVYRLSTLSDLEQYLLWPRNSTRPISLYFLKSLGPYGAPPKGPSQRRSTMSQGS